MPVRLLAVAVAGGLLGAPAAETPSDAWSDVRVGDRLEYRYGSSFTPHPRFAAKGTGGEEARSTSASISLEVVAREPPLVWLEVRIVKQGAEGARVFLVPVDGEAALPGGSPFGRGPTKASSAKVGAEEVPCEEGARDGRAVDRPLTRWCVSQRAPFQLAGGLLSVGRSGAPWSEDSHLELVAWKRGEDSAERARPPKEPSALTPHAWSRNLHEWRPTGMVAQPTVLQVDRIEAIRGFVVTDSETCSPVALGKAPSKRSDLVPAGGFWFDCSRKPSPVVHLALADWLGWVAEVSDRFKTPPRGSTAGTAALPTGTVHTVVLRWDGGSEAKAADPWEASLATVPFPARISSLTWEHKNDYAGRPGLDTRRLLDWGTGPVPAGQAPARPADALTSEGVQAVFEAVPGGWSCTRAEHARDEKKGNHQTVYFYKVSLEVRPDGHVENVHLTKGHGSHPERERCLEQEIAKLTFPGHRVAREEFGLFWGF
jgi:hypothetical protein